MGAGPSVEHRAGLDPDVSFEEGFNAAAKEAANEVDDAIVLKFETEEQKAALRRAIKIGRAEEASALEETRLDDIDEARRLVAWYRSLILDLAKCFGAGSASSKRVLRCKTNFSEPQNMSDDETSSIKSTSTRNGAEDEVENVSKPQASLTKWDAFSPTQRGRASLTRITNSNEVTEDEEGNIVRVNEYRLGSVLGAGSFGVVVRAKSENGSMFAVKIVDRKRLRRAIFGPRQHAGVDMMREIAIQKRLCHPNILPLVEVIDDPNHPKTYLVTAYVDGGALMSDRHESQAIPGPRARRLFVQLVSAVHYLHSNNIIHKDIKPSNLLVDRNDHLYLSDFGAAQAFQEDELPIINRTDGTMAFVAPEMCSGTAFDGKRADIWALGATLYMMVYGRPPFIAQTAQALIETIQAGVVEYPADTAVGEASVDNLLQTILEKDVDRRASLTAIANHAWCTNGGRENFILAQLDAPVTVSDRDIAQAITPYKVSSFQTLGTVLIAKHSILEARARISAIKLRSPFTSPVQAHSPASSGIKNI